MIHAKLRKLENQAEVKKANYVNKIINLVTESNIKITKHESK